MFQAEDTAELRAGPWAGVGPWGTAGFHCVCGSRCEGGAWRSRWVS